MSSGAKARARAAWHVAPEGEAAGAGPHPARFGLHHTSWWRHIHLDYRRYRATGESVGRTLLLSQGFWAGCVYRMARATLNARPRFLRRPLRIAAAFAQKLVEILTGICLPPECEIGEAFYIGHFGTIVLPPNGRIGHNCSVAQNVTIGAAGPGKPAPRIGNRVFIGAHSVIVGDIEVGEDAMICAGSVITRSVPPRAVVMGNPARPVSFDGSFEHVAYDGMEIDMDRRASKEAG